MRNIWVFGGSGYIGRALLEALARDPENRIHVLLHRHSPYRDFEAFNTFTSSLSDFDEGLFRRYAPDVIFHLARLGGSHFIGRSLASEKGRRANERLLSMIRGLDQKPVMVYVSGSLMYGHADGNDVFYEDSLLNPTAYASFYQKAENVWLHARDESGLDVRFARPAWICGPSSWFLHFFWKVWKESGRVPVYGDGSQLMSLVHLRDCASLIELLPKQPVPCQDLNVFSSPPITMREFSLLMADMLNSEIMEIPEARLRAKYGKTTAKALTASIPLGSRHKGLYESFSPGFPSARDILTDTLSFLKNK